MPNLAIDTQRTSLIATGKVMPVTEWTDGKRTDVPKRDPNTGMPLWLVDCLVDDDADRSTVAGVEVPSLDAPIVQKYRPVDFIEPVVSVYVQRSSNALRMFWSAKGIANGKPQAVAS